MHVQNAIEPAHTQWGLLGLLRWKGCCDFATPLGNRDAQKLSRRSKGGLTVRWA